MAEEETERYPAQLAEDVTLRDGETVHLRPIRPGDADALTLFHRGLSDYTVYLRYLSPHARLSERELDRFTHVDYRSRMAFVVLHEARLVGVARYDRLGDTKEAEVAFVLADDFQGRGLGPILLEALARRARSEGIECFMATMLESNAPMLKVFRRCGYPVSVSEDQGTLEVHFPLTPAVMETSC